MIDYRPLLDRLLDKGFAAVTGATIAAIVAGVQRGRMASMLDQLDEEAARLAEEGERLTVTNAVLAGVLAEMAAVALRNRALIDGVAITVQEQGIAAAIQAARQMSLPGISDAALATVGVSWVKPSPEAIARLIQFAQSAAFDNSLRRYGEGVPQLVRDIAIRGITQGRGPVAVARDVRAAVGSIPRYHAESLLRTMQLASYRNAVALSYQANAGIISHQIRVAALDGRACVSCVALHGTRLEVGEVVHDHRNGRCMSIAVIRGLERLAEVETGESWFARQPDDVRRGIVGPGAFDAMEAGRVRLRDFVATDTDAVFGEVVRTRSLTELGLRP